MSTETLLEVAENLAIAAVTEILICQVIDILADESHGTVTKYELCTTHMA